MVRLRRSSGNTVYYDTAVAAIQHDAIAHTLIDHHGAEVVRLQLAPGDDLLECGSIDDVNAAKSAWANVGDM